MKTLAFILICVAVLDMSYSLAVAIPERQVLKAAWRHNKKQFIRPLYSIICDVSAVIVFVAYLAT